MSTRNHKNHDIDTQPLPPRPWRTHPRCGVVDANGEGVGMYRADICRKVVEVFNAEWRRRVSTRNHKNHDIDTQPLPPRPWRTHPGHGVVDAKGEGVGMYRADICRKVVEVFNAEWRRTRGRR